MDKDVQAQRSVEKRDRCFDDFAALFDQLNSPDAVAPLESGLMRMLGTINAAQRDRRTKP